MPEPVLILTGPPGAGKTTTADLLAARADRGVHLESDSFFHFIRAGYVEPWKPESHEQNETVIGIVAAAAAAYAEAGYFTIVDGIISPRWFLAPLRDALKAAGHRVAYGVLLAPPAVCVARVSGRQSGRIADASVVEGLWREFADLGPLTDHAIETEDTTIDSIADEVTRRLRAGLLDV